MTENEEDVIWTKPKQSFKLKKFGARFRGSDSAPVTTTSVKRRDPFREDERENKKQRLCQDRSYNEETDSQTNKLETPVEITGVTNPPLDWSLKTKVRFISSVPLGWTHHLSTVEEASGVTGAVRCLNLSQGSHCLDTSLKAQFHSRCLYWQHPSLPVPLYPRYSQSQSKSVPSLPNDLQQALHSDWMSSLQSVYQLVKARQCPFFYLLGPNFSVLFRAAGVCGSQQISALLTPTTSGIRAALKREDIEFSLPLSKPDSTEAEDTVPETDTTTEFLESLGIEADSLPGLNNTTVKNGLSAGDNIDSRSESLVLVEGVECQSLLNYLLNAKLVTSGPGAAGLPPTLLAPVAFHGASLRSLRVRQGQLGSGNSGHWVEVYGPVLPNMVQEMTRLAANQTSNFSVRLSTLDETVGFSMFRPATESVAPSAFGSASLEDCGLSHHLLDIFTDPVSDDKERLVRNITFDNGGYNTNNEDIKKRFSPNVGCLVFVKKLS